jgi:predicted nucleic-acid-binding protein
MPAIDTKVLVRLVVRDDPAETGRAEEFVAGGAWVSLLALAETVWVLDAVYGLAAAAIARAIGMLLDHRQLVIQDADVARAALATFQRRPKLGFSDCLMIELARKAGHLPLATFDRRLASIDGAKKI